MLEDDLNMEGTYSFMMVGRNTGIELKATLQLKNINCKLLISTASMHQNGKYVKHSQP